MSAYKESINNPQQSKICVVIPTYNNATTITSVIDGVMQYTQDIIVVNDGSTDSTASLLSSYNTLTIVNHSKNRGKGAGLKSGLTKALSMGFEYAITLDADGQHYTQDLPLFFEAHKLYPDALIVSERNLRQENMPSQNTFANKFSNFWFYLQTGLRLKDTQTGYRLYPLKKIKGLACLTARYEAELELLVFAAWSGVQIHSLPIRIYYPKKGQRVTHFRPVRDFARISLLNTFLCFGAIVYALPLRVIRAIKRKDK